MNKKLVVISSFPPYPDNYGAPTSLLYFLLANIPTNISIYLYYFPLVNNNVSQENIDRKISSLNCAKVSQIQCTLLEKINGMVLGLIKLLFIGYWKYPVSSKIIREVDKIKPDYILIYPYWLINWQNRLQNYPTTVIAPDSASLHSLRTLKLHPLNVLRLVSEILRLCSSYLLEYKWGKKDVKIGFVGMSDLDYYHKISTKKNGFYFNHPYMPINFNKVMSTNMSSINVLVSGDAESIYIKNDLILLIQSLIENKDFVVARFNFFFLGKNFEGHCDLLRSYGFNVEVKTWVEDYNKFLSEMDIQIFPICVGTGTKGKVLQAMASGLICIGSMYAFENININDRLEINSLKYHRPEEIPKILIDIDKNPRIYYQLARDISESVRFNHDGKRVAKSFWSKSCGLSNVYE